MQNLPEKQVVQAWQLGLLAETSFTSADGERIDIIYPGRLNDGPGADFTDAVIRKGRDAVRGDIEVHTLSRSWRGHGHHTDEAYNRVVLHVVMQHDTGEATRLQDGREVPVIALERQHLPAKHAEVEGLPCRNIATAAGPGAVLRFLEKAGDERFRARTARWDMGLHRGDTRQRLYEGLMEALGYSRNKAPFLELARRLPLAGLEEVGRCEDAITRQQALLIGTAGLLDRGAADGWEAGLAQLWDSLHHPEPMPAVAWCLFKVRPNNSPKRRLAGMCHLMLRYRTTGLLEGLMARVEQAESGADLVEALVVDCPEQEQRRNALIGRESAAVMALNVLLPCACAVGGRGHRELAAKALCLYCRFPKVAVNSVEKHMLSQLGLESKYVRAARQQQGLLQVYRERCAVGRCGDCPLAVRRGGVPPAMR